MNVSRTYHESSRSWCFVVDHTAGHQVHRQPEVESDYFIKSFDSMYSPNHWPDNECCIERNERKTKGTIYQPLRSGRIWHKVNF